MTLHEFVMNHLAYTFEKRAWQSPLAEAVRGLTARQAAWKPGPERHSIWQIVRHIILWKQSVLDAWDARAADFRALEAVDWADVSGDDDAWDDDVKRLHAISTEIKRRVETLDDTGVAASISWFAGRRGSPIALQVMQAATHDIYHAGQIRHLRALQGAEAPE